MKRRPNLLVIGASGGVANAFLQRLTAHRKLFNKLVLLDKRSKILHNRLINHKELNYLFIHKKLEFPKKEKEYLKILEKFKIDVVLDVTDMETRGVLYSTNKAGISYVNTSINDDKKTIDRLVYDIYPKKSELNKAPHILCTGMNPGNVNMWVRYGIEKFGKPERIIHFEYDSSKLIKNYRPTITWSIHEFLVESVLDPTGEAIGKKKVKKLLPNGIENLENMKEILEPIMKLEEYPKGSVILHEENLTISYKYDIPSKFVYAINQKTLQRLIKKYRKNRHIPEKYLKLADNIKDPLDGADNIGVILEYPDKKIYYFNSMTNSTTLGTSATYLQVIVGIFSALLTLMTNKVSPGIHFVEDLYDTYYKDYLFDNMCVEERVFEKKNNELKLVNFNPMVKTEKDDNFKQVYIIQP